MKYYDFKKIEKIIKADKKAISADLGMYQDWGWTSEEIWNKKTGFTDNFKSGSIGGIIGSNWATPCLKIQYKGDLIRELFPYTEKTPVRIIKKVEKRE